MVSKNLILKSLNDSLDNKCGPTIGKMHSFIDGLNDNEKNTLLKYSGVNMEEYNSLDSPDEKFEMEKSIFKNLSKTQRENILEYLPDFNEENYDEDKTGVYPFFGSGRIERLMDIEQEARGYNPDVVMGVKRWTGGWYDDMQSISLTGKLSGIPIGDLGKEYEKRTFETMKSSVNAIQEYIMDSDGLVEDTILYRGGHWDIGMSIGDIGEIPCFNSTSYSEDTAYNIGIEGRGKKNPYMIKIFAPKGTKGVNINAPSLSPNFPEHEYLLGKGQKYIVLSVDDNNHEASILLI